MFLIGDAIDNAINAAVDTVRRATANAAPGTASFRVQPEQIYQLANRFDEIADDIDGGYRPEILRIGLLRQAPPGADKPSVDAADRLVETGFGPAGLITRLDAYVVELRRAATTLRGVGQQYGLTDHTESERLSAVDG